MVILVVGASGATGKKVVEQLLSRGESVRVIVRSPDRLPEFFKNQVNLSIICGSVLDIDDAEMQKHVGGCDAVISCLGHNITFKGLFLSPRRLVRDAIIKLSGAIKASSPNKKVRLILMNTTANPNHDLNEARGFSEKCVLGIIRLLLPPHPDNEQAAEYLRSSIGQDDPIIEWCAVRPDGLIDSETVTEYTVHPSPIRSPIFDAGKTSRINVGHFMSELVVNDDLWSKWKGQMPVVYNVDPDV